MERYIKDNLKLFGQIINNANVFIDAFDKDGNVVLWNKTAEQITGYTKEEVLGHSKVMRLLYPDPEYYEKVMSSVGTAFKEDYKNVEFTLQTKYGDSRTISWSTTKVRDENGEELGSFGIGIDVTLRKKAQKREKGAFTALMKFMRETQSQTREYEKAIEELKKENEILKGMINSK